MFPSVAASQLDAMTILVPKSVTSSSKRPATLTIAPGATASEPAKGESPAPTLMSNVAPAASETAFVRKLPAGISSVSPFSTETSPVPKQLDASADTTPFDMTVPPLYVLRESFRTRTPAPFLINRPITPDVSRLSRILTLHVTTWPTPLSGFSVSKTSLAPFSMKMNLDLPT